MKYEALIRDARAAGFEVTETHGYISIARVHPRTGHITRGLIIYPNGWGADMRGRWDLARLVRGEAIFRKMLGL